MLDTNPNRCNHLVAIPMETCINQTSEMTLPKNNEYKTKWNFTHYSEQNINGIPKASYIFFISYKNIIELNNDNNNNNPIHKIILDHLTY